MWFLTGSQGTHHGDGVDAATVVIELLAWLGLLVLLGNAVAWMRYRYRVSRQEAFEYVSLSHIKGGMGGGKVVVVDCTAPSGVPTLTHHKDSNNPPGRSADTSTGITLNAIQAGYFSGGETFSVCQLPQVTTNHFDTDSFLSVWCYLNRPLAIQFEPVLRHMARIGDFREAFLSPELVSMYGAEDNVTNIRDAFTALKLCCWLNTLEKRVFSAPYVTKDCDAKFTYFLPRFRAVLMDPEPAWADWQDEYTQVVGGFDHLLHFGEKSVEVEKRTGLAIIRCHEPMHYYSGFSHTHMFDTVLTMYDRQRYEVESKYTQFVSLHSRPVWPRLDMGPLATVLNALEIPGTLPAMAWAADRYTDSGPLLRLDVEDARLTKAQRYGHPFDRPIHASSIAPETMAAVVQSFLEFGLHGLYAKQGGWSWDELRDINGRINWRPWSSAVLEQHVNGQLQAETEHSVHQGSRRISNIGEGHAIPMVVPPGAVQSIMPAMSDNGSGLLGREDVVALVRNCLPARFRTSKWQLAYCTQRDGFSLHTLYRKASGLSPTVLVIKDSGGHIFGAFCPEPWKIGPRFYGTGETRVFSIYPRRTLYPWLQPQGLQQLNDFFMFSTHEGLGVGGSGHYAIWMDNDLLEGSSADCATFGSPCLASNTDFQVASVELWALH